MEGRGKRVDSPQDLQKERALLGSHLLILSEMDFKLPADSVGGGRCICDVLNSQVCGNWLQEP